MAEPKVEIVKTKDGDFRVRLFDKDGARVRVHPGSVGGTRTASQRQADRTAVQKALGALYERQQAEAS